MSKDNSTTQQVTVQDLLDFIVDISEGSFLRADAIVAQTGLPNDRAEQMANLACKVLFGDITAKDIKS